MLQLFKRKLRKEIRKKEDLSEPHNTKTYKFDAGNKKIKKIKKKKKRNKEKK